jgi:Fe-S-cluster-containing hydrogenase component 2
VTRARRVASPFVTLHRSRCEACWECIAVCPESVLGKIDVWFHHHAVVSAGDRCLGCRRCIKVCAAGALSTRDGGRQPAAAALASSAGDLGHDADIV